MRRRFSGNRGSARLSARRVGRGGGDTLLIELSAINTRNVSVHAAERESHRSERVATSQQRMTENQTARSLSAYPVCAHRKEVAATKVSELAPTTTSDDRVFRHVGPAVANLKSLQTAPQSADSFGHKDSAGKASLVHGAFCFCPNGFSGIVAFIAILSCW
jgi:hypothetical protein